MDALRQFVAFIVTKKESIRNVALGQAIWVTVSWLYDNPLYIAVIALYGPVFGGTLMTLGSLIICLATLIWYNKKGVDWVGVGAVDALREISLHYAEKLASWRSDSILGKALFVVFYIPIQIVLITARLANHKTYGDASAFILLSIVQDPFITTAYLRHGKYGPMEKRDWMIFFGSVTLSNGYWIIRTTVVIEIAIALWNMFSK